MHLQLRERQELIAEIENRGGHVDDSLRPWFDLLWSSGDRLILRRGSELSSAPISNPESFTCWSLYAWDCWYELRICTPFLDLLFLYRAYARLYRDHFGSCLMGVCGRDFLHASNYINDHHALFISTIYSLVSTNVLVWQIGLRGWCCGAWIADWTVE